MKYSSGMADPFHPRSQVLLRWLRSPTRRTSMTPTVMPTVAFWLSFSLDDMVVQETRARYRILFGRLKESAATKTSQSRQEGNTIVDGESGNENVPMRHHYDISSRAFRLATTSYACQCIVRTFTCSESRMIMMMLCMAKEC